MNSDQQVIRLQQLTFSYGDKQVLTGIDLEAQAGQIVGYLGPNGAGKSTTIKILLGMLPGFGGEARVLGFDPAKAPLQIKQRVGYVPETADLYELLTAEEFLRFVGQVHGLSLPTIAKRSAGMLEAFELTEWAGKRLETYSKGMRQKVLLSAALIHNPELIFLDEPLSGLDANSALLVKALLAKLAAAGKAIFYSSHVMDVVERVCDRILILDEGRIIADGTFEELQAQTSISSLESIFAQLTGDGAQPERAAQFVEAMRC